jgi:hypothetical protein
MLLILFSIQQKTTSRSCIDCSAAALPTEDDITQLHRLQCSCIAGTPMKLNPQSSGPSIHLLHHVTVCSIMCLLS